MRKFLLLLPTMVFGCASPPQAPAPAPPVTDPTVFADFRIVPRSPDIASYPVEPEHVWVPFQRDRVFVTVKVVNHSLPRISPPPITPPAGRAQVPTPKAPAPLVLRTEVRFAFDRSTLDEKAKAELDRLLSNVGKDVASSDVIVDGYTDSVGSSEYNQRLSNRRALAVRDYLVKKGAASARVAAAGHGESDPEATNSTSIGRSVNRRATVVVTPE